MHHKLILILTLSTATAWVAACSDLPDEVPPGPAAGSGGSAGSAGAKPASTAGASGKASAGSHADADAGEADAG